MRLRVSCHQGLGEARALVTSRWTHSLLFLCWGPGCESRQRLCFPASVPPRASLGPYEEQSPGSVLAEGLTDASVRVLAAGLTFTSESAHGCVSLCGVTPSGGARWEGDTRSRPLAVFAGYTLSPCRPGPSCSDASGLSHSPPPLWLTLTHHSRRNQESAELTSRLVSPPSLHVCGRPLCHPTSAVPEGRSLCLCPEPTGLLPSQGTYPFTYPRSLLGDKSLSLNLIIPISNRRASVLAPFKPPSWPPIPLQLPLMPLFCPMGVLLVRTVHPGLPFCTCLLLCSPRRSSPTSTTKTRLVPVTKSLLPNPTNAFVTA